jgi:hypothetical protein
MGELDLRGLGEFEIVHRMRAVLAAGQPIVVEAERRGVPYETEIEPLPHPSWWWQLPTWCAFVLVGAFLLVRAPHWHLRRIFFVGMLAWACFGVSNAPAPPLQKVTATVVALPLAFALTLWFYLAWAEKGRPGGWGRALAWALGLSWLGVQALQFALGLPTGTLPDRLTGALSIAMPPLLGGALFRTYRRSEPLERRQLRWILYTTLISGLPIALVFFAAAWTPQLDDRFLDLGWSLLGLYALGYAVAVVGYGWLDIDRVISASAAASVLGVALVGGLLAVVPPVASAASTTIGIDPETGRLALSMALAGVLVPAYRRLRPWLDGWMFAGVLSLLLNLI